MLQAAAYIVCAYLSGMRDSEIQAMKRGCLSIVRDEDGVILRHRIKSVAYKGKRGGGEQAEWVTIAPLPTRSPCSSSCPSGPDERGGTTTLWPVLSLRANTKTHVSAEIVRQINRFRDHLNQQFGSPDAPVIPSRPDGAPWRLTTRQFRRTIAWHIANRPFGTIAGMIQYKHASVAAFEGYAGSSRSGSAARSKRSARSARSTTSSPISTSGKLVPAWVACREPRRDRARCRCKASWRRCPP